MNRKQMAILGAAVLTDLFFTAACLYIDTPTPGDYRDYIPLSPFLLPAALAAGVTALVCAATRFWSGRRRYQLGLVLLLCLAVWETVVWGCFGMPFFWITLLPLAGFLYLCALGKLLLARWLFDRVGGAQSST